ncbi:hypothetical protein [Trichocoleus sp. FACHB-262]|uniref:hypothetical protein n=1 Tax=Trichocoleus sp. FACHB-262 TaxID=2692869 RepID=UPI0016851A58|nr:hypothetical protein [Trichocoleus sp. FACHB-262]MBD2122351.1 hypothetical protein [Trichocoleus sp. FACHB-262]
MNSLPKLSTFLFQSAHIMTTLYYPQALMDTFNLKIRLLRLRIYCLVAYIEAEQAKDERRAQVSTPHPKGSDAEKDYIDGYLDYWDTYRERQLLHCPGDRSPHYRQGWEAYAAQQSRASRFLWSDTAPRCMRSFRM